MQIDLDAITQQLFIDPTVRAKIMRDYAIAEPPAHGNALRAAVVRGVQQGVLDRPLEHPRTNAEVFRAAVWAIGSNSRSWITFLRREPDFRVVLEDYDPAKVARTLSSAPAKLQFIKEFLPGQSSSNDARAIMNWAILLSRTPDYYDALQELAAVMRQRHRQHFSTELSDTQLLLALVGYLAYPPTTWPGTRALGPRTQSWSTADWKLPGMGYALGSEFFRNLGFNGFKPDRHIIRLFDRWFPEQHMVQNDVRRLQRLIGTTSTALTDYLRYSLLGISAAPSGVPLSHVDNLVWVLAVYVEKKGKESRRSYLRTSDQVPK